jgi:hypothetical protein
LVKEEWLRAIRKWPHSSAPADEVVVQSPTKNSLFELEQPPRLLPLRMLRDIFLMSHPLLLYQGGEPPASTLSTAGNSKDETAILTWAKIA